MSRQNETYDDSWDRPHRPGPERAWQESDFLVFYDAEARVGATFRLGVHPNRGAGHATLYAFALDGARYAIPHEGPTPATRRPFHSEDRTEAVTRLGGHQVEALGGGRMRYSWDEPECSGEVEWYESFFTPRDWSHSGHASEVMEGINADGHLEAFGRVRGRVRIGPDTHAIDALAYRDRSWGVRDRKMSNGFPLCQVSGTVGPALSFTAFYLPIEGVASASAGFIVRDGREAEVELLRGRVLHDYDGLTPLGVSALFTLEGGEVFEVRGSALQGHGGLYSNTTCEVRYGGDVGFCMLLAGTPARSKFDPTAEDVTYLDVGSGLSESVEYDAVLWALS